MVLAGEVRGVAQCGGDVGRGGDVEVDRLAVAGPPKESRPLLAARAVPPATTRTRAVAMATVRPRVRGRGATASVPYSSGKL
jgi:hypothetical protein